MKAKAMFNSVLALSSVILLFLGIITYNGYILTASGLMGLAASLGGRNENAPWR